MMTSRKSLALSGAAALAVLAGAALAPAGAAPASTPAPLQPLGLLAQTADGAAENVRWRRRHVRCHWQRRCWWTRWGRVCQPVRVCYRPRWW